jgi:hypothetical protein
MNIPIKTYYIYSFIQNGNYRELFVDKDLYTNGRQFSKRKQI